MKKEIIKEIIYSLQEEFAEEGEICVSFFILGEIDLETREYVNVECSGISVYSSEGIYFDPIKKLYFYYGEPRLSVGGEKKFFILDDKHLSMLSTELKQSLWRVGNSKIPETYLFSTGSGLKLGF